MDKEEYIKKEIEEINKSFPKFYFLPLNVRKENTNTNKLEKTLLKIKRRTIPSGLIIFLLIISMLISITSYFELINLYFCKSGLLIFLTLSFCASFYKAKKTQFLLKKKITLIKILNYK